MIDDPMGLEAIECVSGGVDVGAEEAHAPDPRRLHIRRERNLRAGVDRLACASLQPLCRCVLVGLCFVLSHGVAD